MGMTCNKGSQPDTVVYVKGGNVFFYKLVCRMEIIFFPKSTFYFLLLPPRQGTVFTVNKAAE